MQENMKAEFYQLCSAIGRLYVDVKVAPPSMEEVTRVMEFCSTQDHLLGEYSCWFDLP